MTNSSSKDSGTAGASLPGWVIPVAVAAAAVGGAGTAVGLLLGDQQVWWMLLVNFLFWTGVAQACFIWTAIFRTASATWAEGVNKIGHAALNFLWFGLALFVILYLGREHWLTWTWPGHEAPPGKAAWLNVPFFFLRNAAGLIIMIVLGRLYLSWYDSGAHAVGTPDEDRAQGRLNKLAVTLVILFTLIYSMQAFDLIMSLDPHWFSTLFGAYYFIGCLYVGMAAMIILAALLGRPLGLQEHLGSARFRDMGNLLMGFGMFLSGLMFAHVLTIWYGNLPEEVTYLIPRLYEYPWRAVSWFLLVGAYLGPFLLLQSEADKSQPRKLSLIAGLVIISMYVERWFLVVPTLAPNTLAGIAPLAWFVALMCLGVFVFIVTGSLAARHDVSPLDLALELD